MISTKNYNKPSWLPLVIWFLEVIIVLAVCCVVIRISFIPWPPTYTLLYPTHLDRDSSLQVSEKTNQNGTIIFSLVITNPNEGKDIIHGNTVVTFYKNGYVLGVRTITGFYQEQNCNHSSPVLVKVNDTDKNGILEVGLEARVRYRALRWTSKQHLLQLEASVPIGANGELLLGKDGVQLQPVKQKATQSKET